MNSALTTPLVILVESNGRRRGDMMLIKDTIKDTIKKEKQMLLGPYYFTWAKPQKIRVGRSV